MGGAGFKNFFFLEHIPFIMLFDMINFDFFAALYLISKVLFDLTQ